ncbi:MAG TPA: hypothetical protein VF875_16320 [Anaeromyxobacter sp.]
MRRAALAAAALLAALTLARLPDACASGNALNHVSGAWMTLADDLARGTLYRPLRSAQGFGGTRYFPLAFAVQAGLRRAGLGPVAAGEAASLAAGALLAGALVLLLRRLGAGRADAAAGAALAFAGFAGQHALLSARGDLLPVGLGAAALARLAHPGRARVPAAAALLVLAVAAKPTAIGAAAAAIAFLAFSGAGRDAVRLAGLVAAGSAVALAGVDALSSGRFHEALAAVGSGGATARSILAAPLRIAQELLREDPAGLVLCGAAVAVLAASLPRLARRGAADPRLLPALWLAAAWALALAVFGSPGTGVNHLVEIEAASAALVCAALGPARPAGLARAGALAAALAGVALSLSLWRADRAGSRLEEARAVLRALPPGAPLLSEDPLVPLLAGESPVLLDAFALRLVAEEEPAFGAPLEADLRRGAFPAIVLLADLRAADASRWYACGNLGLPLVGAIRDGYRPAGAFGRYHLLVPRGGAAPGVARRGAPR